MDLTILSIKKQMTYCQKKDYFNLYDHGGKSFAKRLG